jgi:YegS/Rv2252/BmrU family lipid kinase
MRRYRNPRSLNNAINQLSTNLIGSVRRQTARKRRVIVIVNPVAGQDRPILKTINSAMHKAEVDWNLVITRQAGDGFRLARQAVAAGADTVAVYGGDGTIAEVASGLGGSKVSLGILPGGTSNWITNSLGIPKDLNQALSLALQPDHATCSLHLGLLNKVFFIQMVGIGLEAKVIEGAPREAKARFGLLAYALSVLQSIANPPVAHYHMLLDDHVVETDGVTCMLLNADNLILPGLAALPPGPRSGLLDIFVPQRADVKALFSVAATMAGGGPELVMLPHWQARRISIVTDPPQLVQSDGEVIGHTPIKARVTARTVRIIVSPEKAAALHSYTLEGEEGDLPFEGPLPEQPDLSQEPALDDDEPDGA